MSEEVQQIARDPSRKIEAIKLPREQTGLGLAEAKSEVEDFIKTIPWDMTVPANKQRKPGNPEQSGGLSAFLGRNK